ncbi:MAG: hypothetical protein U5P41_08305 [Gammaproteobacteria bacterium]|nr:hypothetical protein [Gammaproteobacteria bacterium]
MKKVMMSDNWLPRLVTVVALLTGPLSVNAAIVNVSPAPARTSTSLNAGSATVNVTWQVQRVAQPNVGANVVSQNGRFLIGGRVVDTVNRSLSRVFPGSPSGTEFATFTETVSVSRSLVVEAARRDQLLTFQRAFDDGTGSSSGEIVVAISGGAGGDFALTRIDLKFEDESRVRVLPGDESVRALAEINFTGSGILRAVWEIAGPASTAGEPIFRPLTIVRRNLAGGDRIIITSPQLPTDSQGLHVIRLRIEEPAADFALPILRYFVTESAAAADPVPPSSVQLQSPTSGALLALDSEFTWQPLPDGRAYMLQFYPAGGPDEPEAPPLAAVLVPGDSHSTTVEPLTWRRFETGSRYRWRVRALGEDGSLIGLSGWREILTPAREREAEQ